MRYQCVHQDTGLCLTCMNYESTIASLESALKETGNSPDLAYKIFALEKEVERLIKDNEVLIWNLGGCSTYALGYGLDESHDKEMARPALEDVKKLALRERSLHSDIVRLREGLEKMGFVGASIVRCKDCQRNMDIREEAHSSSPTKTGEKV